MLRWHYNLGVVPVGIPQARTLTLKNVGAFDAVFTVEVPKGGASVKCEPKIGRVAVGSLMELEVVLEAPEPGVFDSVLAVQIRGGKTVKLPIHAEVGLCKLNPGLKG